MTSSAVNASPESAKTVKPSVGRERLMAERSRGEIKKQFVHSSVASSQSDSINKAAAKNYDGKITKTVNLQSQQSSRNPMLSCDRQTTKSTSKETPKSANFGETSLNGNKFGGPSTRSDSTRSISQQKTGKLENGVHFGSDDGKSGSRYPDEVTGRRNKLVADLVKIQEKTDFTNQRWFQIETLKLALQNAAFYPNYYRVELEKHAADLCKDNK